MEPIDFKEMNWTYGPPKGMTEEDCGSLDCYRNLEDRTVTTKWKLTWKERFKIFFSGILWVCTLGIPPQPIALNTVTPFQTEQFKLWWFIKCIAGFGNVIDGSTCWFSRKYWDVHDYYSDKGGDDTACHVHTYTCHKCGKEFVI
jgi:hypothetical protein